MGHCSTNDTHMICNENAYKDESEVLAEFLDFDMAEKFLNKYDPQFKYDYNVKDDYTEIVLQTKITKTNEGEE